MDRWAIAFALLAAACGGNGPGVDPDGGGLGDGGGDGDGDGDGGLAFEIRNEPDIPGPFNANFEPSMDEVEIVISDFRAVGDAAPGDDRTRIATLVLEWDDGLERLTFDKAPVGRYSHLRGRVESFTSRGTLTIADQDFTWEIVDDAVATDLELDLGNLMVVAGESADVVVEVDLTRPYKEVDWDQITPDDGVLRFAGTFDEIAEVRKKIGEAFDVEDES